MVSLRHRLWLTGFFAASMASMLVACGGKVVVDAGGATGGGGAASTSTSSVGVGGVGGAGGCEGLQADLQAKVAAAQACNPALSVPQCSGALVVTDTCGCLVVANDGSAMAAQIANLAFDAWVGAGCGPYPCTLCPPGPPSPWYCDPTDSVCKPVFEK
jgi:hypothetical protein